MADKHFVKQVTKSARSLHRFFLVPIFCCFFLLSANLPHVYAESKVSFFPFLFLPSPTPALFSLSFLPTLFSSDQLASPTPYLTPTETPTPTSTSGQIENGYCLSVPILLYHHIEPLAEATSEGHAQLTVDATIFDVQMAYLEENHYHVISVDEILQALLSHTPLPKKSIAVTLDDGYIDAYTFAYPIAKKYSMPINYMIPTGLIGKFDYMTWSMLKEMSGNPLTHIYNHTWSHAAIGIIPLDQATKEVSMAKQQLADNLGVHTDSFVYPYGSFSPESIKMVQSLGYRAGLSTIKGTLQCDSYIMALHRTHIGNAPLSAYGF